MGSILPLNPNLPDPPKTIDACPAWASDFSRAFVDIYTQIARRLENATMEQIEALRPVVQGTRRIYIPDDADQVDFERSSGWFSTTGVQSFLNHLNSSIEIAGFVNFKPGSDLSTASTTYVAIDSTNFKVTLTLDANRSVLMLLSGGQTNESGGANLIHMDVDVDSDLVGGSSNGIIQVNHGAASTPAFAGVAFKTRSNLTAASHVFTPVWRVSANTGLILGAGTDHATTLTLLIIEFRHGNT